jgi:D-alanine-D-alanine ligase
VASRVRIAVLNGGSSAEREVSLRSGTQVAHALRACGHIAEQLDVDLEVWERLRRGGFDCAFVALHGRLGEDGTVQGMLELLGLPYTGSGVLASALCIDKPRVNRLLSAAGLAVPDFEEVEGDDVERLAERYGLPLVLKPAREGSTIGLTIARDIDEAATGLMLARRYDSRVVAQRFVSGTEITVGVLATPDLQVLPTLEITYDNATYDYDAKYTAGRSHHIIPARIPEAARTEAARAAGEAFGALGCEGMARVDFIVDAASTPWVLEVNTVPGLTEVSLLPDAARAGGVGFDELCERLVRHAVLRHEQKVGPG